MNNAEVFHEMESKKDFMNLRISEVPMIIESAQRYERSLATKEKLSGQLDAAVDRANINVAVNMTRELDEIGHPTSESIRLTLNDSKKNEFAYGTLQIDYDRQIAGVKVKSRDRAFKGIGRVIWKKMIEHLEHLCETQGAEITHRVLKGPEDGLSDEKWDELFVPLLEENGYVNIGFHSWEKTYGSLHQV